MPPGLFPEKGVAEAGAYACVGICDSDVGVGSLRARPDTDVQLSAGHESVAGLWSLQRGAPASLGDPGTYRESAAWDPADPGTGN